MKKIDRSAFLYMESKRGLEHTFAQCASCAFFNSDASLCNIMDIGVEPGDTCAMYLEGPSVMDYSRILAYSDEIGFESRAVRCENCQYAINSRCQLYAQLNSMFPEMFDLNTEISPYGCCNANTPKEG